jgi:four helix bundle protein
MKNFRNLQVWQKSHALTLQVYQVTNSYPKSELFSLTSQTRRAAASVPANIAEGYGRGSDAEFGRFLHIASGSACELEYHLMLAHDLNFLSSANHATLDAEVNEIKRMLAALQQKLKAKS